MKLLRTDSLAETIDNLNDAFFYGHKIPATEKTRVAKWIAGRQGLKGSYANMFAPSEKDFKSPIKVFTGEQVRSRAATAHILGEEAGRALILLKVKDPSVRSALKIGTEGMIERMGGHKASPGMYCCGICTASYWRHHAVGGLVNNEQSLKKGLRELKKHRDGKGRWKRFPFYYTVLALNDIDLPAVKTEIKYIAPILEKYVKRQPNDDSIYHRRRFDLAERLLGKI